VTQAVANWVVAQRNIDIRGTRDKCCESESAYTEILLLQNFTFGMKNIWLKLLCIFIQRFYQTRLRASTLFFRDSAEYLINNWLRLSNWLETINLRYKINTLRKKWFSTSINLKDVSKNDSKALQKHLFLLTLPKTRTLSHLLYSSTKKSTPGHQ
jgi:hypothetical protein